MMIHPSTLFFFAAAASQLGTSSAKPNEMATKSCGMNGNPRKCTVDTSQFDVGQPDGTVSEIDLGNGHAYSCRARRTAHGKGYHGSCVARGKPVGDDGDGDLNIVARGKNSRGEDCITGSLSVEGHICQIRPDATCDNTVVECKPASEYPDEGDAQEVIDDVPVGSSGLFRKLVTDPVDRERSRLRGVVTPSNKHRGLYDDLGGNLDTMVVWTKAAECRNSNLAATCTPTSQTEANMRALIDLAIVETNTAYDLSGVNTQLRLVHAYRDESYTEVVGDAFSRALNEITNTNDSIMDDVHAKRSAYGADLVAMIIDDSALCGLAWLGPSYSRMFSVSSWSCATGYYSFGHEIGHNFGCNHDRGTTGTCSSTSYAYGWRDPQAAFRTTLAYNCATGQCDNNAGTSCQRIQRYSNPNFLYNGKALGNALNDNARRINDVKATVAAYESFVPACTTDSDCNDSNACTTNVCNGVCVFEPIDCNDNNACTVDSCSGGSCINTPLSCDDGNACTLDTCDVFTGCVHTPIPGCCGNGICEPGSGEDSTNCLVDCSVGPFTLATTQCTSCYIQDGNMFDVKAKDAKIQVTSLKMFIYNAGAKAEVWTRAGTHVGFEYSSNGWIKVADTVISASSWTFADVSITPVTIPAGATQAFYITVDGSGDVLYSIGTQSLTAIIAEDDRMIIYEGPAKVYQFGGQTSPRVWNGEFTYLKENGVVATLAPTKRPTNFPTNVPTTAKPTNKPTSPPTNVPTPLPTKKPTSSPTSSQPTKQPVPLPTNPPTTPPTNNPTVAPKPTMNPTPLPTNPPTPLPTNKPTNPPTPLPTNKPTIQSTPPPTFATVVKYICSKNQQSDPTICSTGAPALGTICNGNPGASCGNGGKKCWLAACSDTSENPPPTPTTPPASPPTQCIASGRRCPPEGGSGCCSGSCNKRNKCA